MPLRKAIVEFIAQRGWTAIGEAEWPELKAAFPHVTASSLLKAGIQVSQPFRGVEQHSFEELKSSLVELAGIYAARPDLRRFTRDQVIRAKDQARWASRNPRVSEAARRRKAEMVAWMLVWLDDPAMFETWVRVRRARMESGVLSRDHAEETTPMPFIPEVNPEEREKCDVCGGSGDCTQCKGTGSGGLCFNCAGTGNCPQCQGTGLRKKKNA